MDLEAENKTANQLVHEKSPYLLQHAYNPVDWYAWGEEAFEKARAEDKPIFLSIGYSTCHWCHVMERESFEDHEVAELMNVTFVNIKVDREERPDIDKVYMQVGQMMTGRGGWPLTIVMTPDKEPFFAATYISKDSIYGQLGMLELIPRLREIWETDRENITEITGRIQESLSRNQTASRQEELGQDTIDMAFSLFSRRFDDKRGGFGTAPKFPSPHNLMLLLRYWKKTGDDWALHMVERTLQEMRRGGIFDQVGFGFHRYSTDANWLLPHFEKMLYDQAMLIMAYIEAFEVTGKSEYAEVVHEVVEYVLRDMTSPEGAFYSAEDADSEGVEGKFYVWSKKEIDSLLTKEEAEGFTTLYNVRKEGNFRDEASGEETGLNIPHMTLTTESVAKDLKLTPDALQSLVMSARKKLAAAREKRVKPHRDDKVLVDWNGLFIAALAKAARSLHRSSYAETAERAVEFILTKMRSNTGRLFHRFREGEVAVDAFLDDYAFLIWGLIELYETTFDPKYLELALDLNETQLKHFWDDEGGAFFFTADDSEELLVRQKEAYDGAIPSGNSVSMLNLIRLARLLGEAELENRAAAIGKAFSSEVSRTHSGFSFMLAALDFALGPSHEIVIAGQADSKDTEAMLNALRERYLPSTVVLLRTEGEVSKQIDKLAPFSKFFDIVNGAATAHVCINHNCKLPTNDVNQMLKLLDETPSVSQ
ncbi:MAG: thioredoxin domain-containing protein [Candidatus Thorarchaeota archaeon]